MASSNIIIPGSLNLAINPLKHKPGDMIRAQNITNDQFGAKKKRPGYITYLGTLGAEVTSLFNFTMNNGSFWNYAVAGGTVFYSTQGTGAWAVAGNGTLTNQARPGNAVMNNVMIIGDGTAATRHTTNGTSFTNTTSAPIANYFTEYQRRIWAGGTASDAFFSTQGTATDWTSDSSSVLIPGSGRLNGVFKAADRTIFNKTSGNMFRWDGFNLVDLATNLGPSSASGVADIEDYRFFPNRLGYYGFGGDRPELISNSIEKMIYNDAGEGIAGTIFDNMPGVAYRYEYMTSIGTVTDDLTGDQVTNAIPVYDYQTNEWWVNSFGTRPTAMLSFINNDRNQQMIFGDASGQCYTYGGTATSDNGLPINVEMQGIITADTLMEKKWKWFRAMFNPGCEAEVQVAITDSFNRADKEWKTIGSANNGIVEIHFPPDTRGRILYWQIIESSKNARMHFFGIEFDAELEGGNR